MEAACSKRRRRDSIPLPRHFIPELRTAIAAYATGANIFPSLSSKKTQKMIKVDLATAGIEYQTEDGAFRDLECCGGIRTSPARKRVRRRTSSKIWLGTQICG